MEFIKTIHSCIAAAVPCVAVSTTETEEVVKQVVEYASKHTHKLKGQGTRRRVFVWRESVGFEEYGVYARIDGKEQQIDQLTSQIANARVKPIPDAVYAPNNPQIGATIPFAVEFMTNYRAKDEGHGAIFVLRDWHRYVGTPDQNGDHVDRQLALFEGIVAGKPHGEKSVIFVSPNRWNAETIPVELSQHVYQTQFDMPEKAERLAKITAFHREIVAGGGYDKVEAMSEHDLETLADALGGLTRKQMNNVLCMSLVSEKGLDMNYCLTEKRKLVEQAGFNMSRPLTGFENIGGLQVLKTWSQRLRVRFTAKARDFGFTRFPRGLLLAGVPGCGKSAIAKALANEWGMNLLTVQATDLKGSLVGESEAKVHRLLSTARAAAPIIIFIDEAEKLLGKSEGIHDGGAHDAVLGQFLSFMQEDDSGVFFVFTANNMEKFAPELVDRFEGRFFVDLPVPSEREAILRIHLTMRKQDPENFDMKRLVALTNNFSGRNIEDCIEDAMMVALSDDRDMTTDDLVGVFQSTIPTSETKADEIATRRV
jgi:AAA+ superfamily predicted ATPase